MDTENLSEGARIVVNEEDHEQLCIVGRRISGRLYHVIPCDDGGIPEDGGYRVNASDIVKIGWEGWAANQRRQP